MMAGWAFRPELLDHEMAKNLSIIHGDLVELVTEAEVEAIHTPFGVWFKPTGTTRIVWHVHEEVLVPGHVPLYGKHDPHTETVSQEEINRAMQVIDRQTAERLRQLEELMHPIPYPTCTLMEGGCDLHPYVS